VYPKSLYVEYYKDTQMVYYFCLEFEVHIDAHSKG